MRHALDEIIEEIQRIMGSRIRLGMVLYGKCWSIFPCNALYRLIIEVNMR